MVLQTWASPFALRLAVLILVRFGLTVVAPTLEICEVLAFRGQIIEFATLAERQRSVDPYSFVSAVHIIGRAITPEDEQLYSDTFNGTIPHSMDYWTSSRARNFLTPSGPRPFKV